MVDLVHVGRGSGHISIANADMSPIQRTHAKLKSDGYLVGHCERKVPSTAAGYSGPLFTQDLFGIIDTIALHKDRDRPLAVQSCAGSGHAAHREKIMASKSRKLVTRHFDLEIWSWAKRGERGKRKLWSVRRERIQADYVLVGLPYS